MKTKFTIGLGLQGSSCTTPASALGEVTAGPMQLLSWLESQLGLELPEASFTARMVPYLNCLLQQRGSGRFFEESLQQDEFGVARTLLQWRDTWYEAGWNGDGFDAEDPTRLLDMAAVEATVKADTPPGIGQRVQRVLATLEDTPIDLSLSLLDSLDVFPKVWRQLFIKLGATTNILPLKPGAGGDSDLAVLQRRLVADRKSDQKALEKARLKGDGSVIVLRDGSPQLSAAWVSRFIHTQLDETGSVGILAPDHGATFDDALTAAGFPRLGFSDTSFWRPVFQVLPLSLELLWDPLDPAVLLQFLAHPMGPIPVNIRRPLAEVVAEEPGIGGDTWHRTIEFALDKATTDLQKGEADKKRKDLSARIEFWLNSQRFDPQTGVDIKVLQERVQRVSQWLSQAFAMQDHADIAALYSAALSQSDELYRTLVRLESTGTDSLRRESLRRLVEAVRGQGTSRPGRPWQCEPDKPQLLKADSPAECLDTLETVVWWGCDHEQLPSSHPWSKAELAAIGSNGIELLPVNTQLQWQASTWLRPILAATDRLVLVLHDNADGHHPVFDQLLAVSEDWIEQRIDRVMQDPALLRISRSLPETSAIQQRALPGKTRWWQLPADVAFTAREQESFTSLEKFLYGPYQWVLNYQARVRPGTLFELDDGSRLKGSLVHALFERFFRAHEDIGSIDLATAERWARASLTDLIEKQGAVLLMPGRWSERVDFTDSVVRALKALITHLQSASVVKVEMEKELQGKFVGGDVRGTVDLIATNANGEYAIIDIKWGGFNYRQKTLVDSRYLQLAIYAQLAYPTLKKWPALGYFIIRDARMLVLDSLYFPKAAIEKPDNGESLLEFWQRAEKTWKWRSEQLGAGLVEVTVTDTEPDEDSSPGEFGLVMPETFDDFDDYTFLTGWDDRS